MEDHGQDNGIDEFHVLPDRKSDERLRLRQGVAGIEHLNHHEDGERNSRGTLGHMIGKHLTSDIRKLSRALVEVCLLIRKEMRWVHTS